MAAAIVIVIDTIGWLESWVHFRTRSGRGLATLTQHYSTLAFKVCGHGWLAGWLPRNGTSACFPQHPRNHLEMQLVLGAPKPICARSSLPAH